MLGGAPGLPNMKKESSSLNSEFTTERRKNDEPGQQSAGPHTSTDFD